MKTTVNIEDYVAGESCHNRRPRAELEPRMEIYMRNEQGLKCLDKMIAHLGGVHCGTQSQDGCGLLMEHLQAARRDLLGSMPGEYRLSLQQAEESVACISEKTDRIGMRKALRALIDSEKRDDSGVPAPNLA
jgi:hypothetical protein